MENDIKSRLARINEFADNDPVTAKLRQNYIKANDEKKLSKERKENNFLSLVINANTKSMNESEEKLYNRAKQNLYLSKRSTKEEKEIRRFEDLKLILNPDNIQPAAKETKNLIPLDFFLSQNYPNPFNPVTNIEFGISKLGFVTLKVYDILGKEVATLVNEILSPGKYTVKFNGSNLASGIYFCKMESREFKDIKRIMLIK